MAADDWRKPKRPMKIARIRATPVPVRMEAPCVWSSGVLCAFTKCVVELETTNGAIGIAECPFCTRDKHLLLPTDPGLGVTSDPDRLAFAARLLVKREVPNKCPVPQRPTSCAACPWSDPFSNRPRRV